MNRLGYQHAMFRFMLSSLCSSLTCSVKQRAMHGQQKFLSGHYLVCSFASSLVLPVRSVGSAFMASMIIQKNSAL